jgi:hypothetical protein
MRHVTNIGRMQPLPALKLSSSLRPLSEYCKIEVNIMIWPLPVLWWFHFDRKWVLGYLVMRIMCTVTMWSTMSLTEYPWFSSKVTSLVCTLPSTLHNLPVECKWGERGQLTLILTYIDFGRSSLENHHHCITLGICRRNTSSMAPCVPWLASGLSTDQPSELMDLFDTRGMASWLWALTLVKSFWKEG